jgi:Rod binding domain-containing protein
MDAVNSSSSTNSYLDFDGLGQLKGQARKDAKGAMRETAQQFEAMFIQMMMKSMRDSIVKSDLSESSTVDTFEGMFDKEVSVQLSKRNSMGLADMLVKNLEQQQASMTSTAELLKQRQDPAAFAAKPMALNPPQPGMALDKLNPKQGGFALPKPQLLPLNLPPRPFSGSGT